MRLLRWAWAQLTSMRTALILLFALALAAIPGSMVPQRDTDQFKVSDFLKQHPTLGPIYDKVGLFHVFTSPWFSAIYLLLFVSLVGCIIPRIAVYARAVRAQPPAVPRRLARLPGYTKTTTELAPAAAVDAAEQALRIKHYRVVRRDTDDGTTLSAERGYFREAGNLVFHTSLLFLLLGVAISNLWGFRGDSVVVVGQGFSNTLTQYDDITAGAAFNESGLAPFTVKLDNFVADYETGPVQTGAARLFRADVTVTPEPGATPQKQTFEVNHPLNITGTTVHLTAHGYAPRVTVTDGNGDLTFSGPVVFLPQDSNLTSYGVIKTPDARPERLAFTGFFLPTAAVDQKGPRSVFPGPLNPLLLLNGYYGPPRAETGQSENVYTLNSTGLTQFRNAAGTDLLRMTLAPGQTIKLPDGKGSITYDGYDQWVKLQISRTPGLPVTLTAIGAAVLGLCLSLFIRPRRIWVRATSLPQGNDQGDKDDEHDSIEHTPTGTVFEVGGLDRADARTGLTDEIGQLTELAAPPDSPPRETP